MCDGSVRPSNLHLGTLPSIPACVRCDTLVQRDLFMSTSQLRIEGKAQSYVQVLASRNGIQSAKLKMKDGGGAAGARRVRSAQWFFFDYPVQQADGGIHQSSADLSSPVGEGEMSKPDRHHEQWI